MEYKHFILIATMIIALSSMFIIYHKMNVGFGNTNLKIYGITIVVFAGLILSLSDVTGDKTAAYFSILGGIAGYLFGLKDSSNNNGGA